MPYVYYPTAADREVQHDPGFARVYLEEKLALLEVLKEGDPTLWETAHALAVRGLERVRQ